MRFAVYSAAFAAAMLYTEQVYAVHISSDIEGLAETDASTLTDTHTDTHTKAATQVQALSASELLSMSKAELAAHNALLVDAVNEARSSDFWDVLKDWDESIQSGWNTLKNAIRSINVSSVSRWLREKMTGQTFFTSIVYDYSDHCATSKNPMSL